jgi:G2/mitotic-specific cyclin-B, other
MGHFPSPLSQSCDSCFLLNHSIRPPVILQNAVALAPAHPAAPRAAPKPARKAPAKPAPRPEQASKPAPRPEQASKPATGLDLNKKPSEGVAGSTSGSSCRSVRNSRKKVVNTLTTVLSARSKVSDGTGTPLASLAMS